MSSRGQRWQMPFADIDRRRSYRPQGHAGSVGRATLHPRRGAGDREASVQPVGWTRSADGSHKRRGGGSPGKSGARFGRIAVNVSPGAKRGALQASTEALARQDVAFLNPAVAQPVW